MKMKISSSKIFLSSAVKPFLYAGFIFIYTGCNGPANAPFSSSASSSQSNEISEDTNDTDKGLASADAQGTDEPVWINGVNLLGCEFLNIIENTTDVLVQCHVQSHASENSTPNSLNNTSYTWKVIYNETIIESGSDVKKDEVVSQFIFPASPEEVAQAIIEISSQGTNGEGNYRESLLEALEKMLNISGETLTSCLSTQVTSSEINQCYFPTATSQQTATATNVAPGPAKRIFFTSNTYPGAWDSLNQADTFCNSLAKKGNLGGTWKALISTSMESTASRFIYNSPVPLKNLADETVLANVQDLFNGANAENGVNYDETGAPWSQERGSNLAAVGLFPNGTVAKNCNDWSNSASEVKAVAINSASLWIDTNINILLSCDALRFLCIEQ
ncbi:MAG: hypothetical protein R3B45_15290 [Bdellovibrionota bacterium]